MKTAIFLLLAVMSVPVFASERELKQQLIAEVLEVIDAKALTQASFDIMFGRMDDQMAGAMAGAEGEATPEQAAAYREQQEQMRAFRDRLYTRIDYAKYAEEIYAPLFDKHFSSDDLKELIAFYKTKAGQKSLALLPELAIGGMLKGSELLQQAARQTSDEIEEEQAQKHPDKKTMADMRTLATALEARATDEESYPDVDLAGLEKLLEPIYVKDMPEKDAWGTPFIYIGNESHYRIVSAGADKRFEWNARQFSTPGETRPTDNPDADIVFEDGVFMQYPRKYAPQQ